MATPYAMVFEDTTTSTQDDARRLLGDFPTLVVASEQTRGRGRSGAAWENADVALAASLAFRPTWPTEAWPRLTLLAGLAAARVLGAEFGLKWPNDVVRDGDKVGGLLTEANGDVVVVGFGANLYWPDSPPGIAAIHHDEPDTGERARVAQNWAEALLEMAACDPEEWPRDEYRRRCTTLGVAITWEPSGSGTAVDVDPSGGLVVEHMNGREVLTAGAVHEIRPV
jgi:BirA family biotin operon repressor/biotin-[acetyl-CoA-carboxylase] ligase